ncbi:transporter [Streptomyces sp. NPDC051940]|uniref:transporter n=1 Tax=Streptomyces sp. NPDC051940 TaxID=3155675 RepID=UPI00342C6906
MIWVAWRQFRTQALAGAAALAALGLLLAATAGAVSDAYDASGLRVCGTDCGAAGEAFLREAKSGAGGVAYDVATLAMYVVPLLIGVFWGAPLLARELETGTYRLAWNQSVPRTRWLAVKLGLLGAAAAVTAGLLSLAVTAWAHRIDLVTGERITPQEFSARGVVPVGYALFAFTLGVAVGMVVRRAIPAMAVTLGVYYALAYATQGWIRERLVPPYRDRRPLDVTDLDALQFGGDAGAPVILGRVPDNDGWVLANQTLDASGHPFTGPLDPRACAPDGAVGPCRDWLAGLGLQQRVTYHPSAHFWPLQWAETGLLLTLAALLTAFCLWWTRHRLT